MTSLARTSFGSLLDGTDRPDRRGILAALALLPLVGLAGCATGPRYTLEEGVHRLLMLSSQRAFGRLTQPGGFYDDQLTRIQPPDLAGDRTGAVISAMLRTSAVRDRIAWALDGVAVTMANRAAPIVLDAVRTMSVADAISVMRGGPTAATDLLERQTHGAIMQAILPGTTNSLRGDAFELLFAALTAASGRDYAAMADNVSGQITHSIFRAIGREEAEIRRNPRETRDPVLIALLGVGGR